MSDAAHGYMVVFTAEEAVELAAFYGELHSSVAVHDAALDWVRSRKGIHGALAALKGSEPTQAEIRAGMLLREEG